MDIFNDFSENEFEFSDVGDIENLQDEYLSRVEAKSKEDNRELVRTFILLFLLKFQLNT
jgi:hypothetical protein